MYCQSCGTASTPGLSYCNRCGASLSVGRDRGAIKPPESPINSLMGGVGLSVGKDHGAIKPPESPINSLMDSTFWVTVFGLGVIVGGVLGMKALELREVFIIAYMVLSTLAFLGIYGMHVWQFIRLTSDAKKSGGAITGVKETDTKELGPAPARTLAQPMPSVTEHTTRAFDRIYNQRKAE